MSQLERELFSICAPSFDKLRAKIREAKEAILLLEEKYPGLETTVHIRDVNHSDIVRLNEGEIYHTGIHEGQKYRVIIILNNSKIKIYERE